MGTYRTTTLFVQGKFTLNSGLQSNYKIECNALTWRDWKTLAMLIADDVINFGEVVGVSDGGLQLAGELERYKSAGPRLVVDDVWTTGKSLLSIWQPGDIGYVVFNRGPLIPGVKSLFTFNLMKPREDDD